MLRRLIYVLAIVVASGTVGYLIALETQPPAPPLAEAHAHEPDAEPGSVDWSKVPDQDLRVSGVFLTARNVGVEAALDTLQALASMDADIARRGHTIAHALGRFFIDRNND